LEVGTFKEVAVDLAAVFKIFLVAWVNKLGKCKVIQTLSTRVVIPMVLHLGRSFLWGITNPYLGISLKILISTKSIAGRPFLTGIINLGCVRGINFHRIPCLLQCRFLPPEERVKGTVLSPEVTTLSRLALQIIREEVSPVPEEKETGLAINGQAINNQERHMVMGRCKITHIDLGTLVFLRIYMAFKILITNLISLLTIPAVNPEAHQMMAE
tara:strand:+ start:400 stop:1038 length:639 start_codon:yes stop_codon:yes gene_type:complete